MARSVPVVATSVGGVPNVVKHEHSGMLVTPGSPNELADAITRLISEPTLRDNCIRNGLTLASQYTVEVVWNSMMMEVKHAFARLWREERAYTASAG